ncbi:hypothetical protein CBR_g6338 [Chara braunii]|uniref:Uncharacterized protein n=1 Tax=Chara braunii TaxID=69332 RepID=A0A388KJK3_CHABU|nr:hypothetical protein CBR_g6338 [Chara braunii]|eukprot:GBG70206.1 hypothetical protein CBR_g6338 [Chara braunii]
MALYPLRCSADMICYKMALAGAGERHDSAGTATERAGRESGGNCGGPASTSGSAPVAERGQIASSGGRYSGRTKRNPLYYKYDNRQWFLDWVSVDKSALTSPPCGGVVFVRDHKNFRLVGAVSGWEDCSEGVRTFTLQTTYEKDGRPNDDAHGVRLSWKKFRGFDKQATMLPFYTTITSDLEPTVLLRVFFDEWERVVPPARCLDVPQEHRISMPISYVGGDEDRMRTSEMSTAVAAEGATGVLDPSYVPEQPEPSGAYEESEPEGEAVERRHAKGAVADVAQGPVSATNEPSTGEKTTGVSTSGGDHEVAEQPRDMGKRPVAVGEKRSGEESESEGAGDEHRHVVQSDKKKRKTSTPRQTSGKKRKSGGRNPETPKARRGGGTREGSSKDKRARADENNSEDDKNKVVDLDAGYFLEGKEGVRKDVTLSIDPERVLELPTWESRTIILGMKFYDEWEKGHLLASDGAVWTKKPPTADPKVTREGQSFAEDNSGHKKVVYNVRVTDLEMRKGKKKRKQEERDFFVQVNEPDVHCWKDTGDFIDAEKRQILRGLLDLDIVWVQIGSKKLIEQGKVGMKDACEMVKQDRMLLRLWHIVQFQHEGHDNDDWNDSFFRTKEQLMAEYASKGLDEKLWAGCRKWVTDHSYLKECPQCLGCPNDKDVAATMKLVNHEKFPTEWKRVVLSVLKGERSKTEEGPQALGECTNVKWKHTSQVTTLAPFAYDAFTTFLRKDEMRKVVTQLRCHTCIIDFCDPVDRARWNEEAFRSLAAFLEVVQKEVDHDPDRNMWFKLSAKKRASVYKFLFLDTRPKLRFEDDYKCRRDVVIRALDGYHGASREAAANFVEKLEECYFDNGKMELTSTDESDWGHHIVWHPDVFQPAVIDSEWVMAFNDKGDWKSEPRLSKKVFEEAALQAVIDHVAEVNCRQPDEFVIKVFGEQTYEILREHNMLELCRDFYYLETSPSYWHIPPPAPTREEGAGRGGRGGNDDGGDGGGEDRTRVGGQGGHGGASDNRGGGARRGNITSAGGVTIAGRMGGMASAEGASSQTGQGSPHVESPPPMHSLQASELVGQGQHAFPGSGCIRDTVSAGSNFMADAESVDMASTMNPGCDTRECEVVTDATLLDGENVVEKPVGGSHSTERTDSLARPCATRSEVDKGWGLRVGIFSVGTGCIRHASGRVSVEQTEDLVAGSFSAGGGYIRSSARQLSSTNDTLVLGTEDQETAPFDMHYGGSEGGHVSLTEPAEKPAGGSYFPQMGFEGHKELGLRDGGSFIGARCIRRPSLRDNAEWKEDFVVAHTSQQTRNMDNTLALNMEDQQTPPPAHQLSSTDDTLALGMEDQEAAPFDTHYGCPKGGHVSLTIASEKLADGQKGHGVRDGGSFAGAGCIRRRSLRVGAEQTPPPTEQQPRSTDNTPALGVEDQETPPRDAHCGGSQGGYVSQLCSGLPGMRPSKIITAIVVSDQCNEDEDVTMLEGDEVAVRHPIEDDLVKTLFREFDSPVVISPSSQLLTPQDEVLTIRGSGGTAGRPIELCPSAPGKVVCLVDVDIKDLSRFPSRLDGIMASTQTEEFVLGLSTTCLGKDLPQSKGLDEKEHLRHQAVAGKQ